MLFPLLGLRVEAKQITWNPADRVLGIQTMPFGSISTSWTSLFG